ncbi:MAG: alpha/beta hydrolase [Bacteroidetes bacterium]|jgi:pimeloyl-ACP methyl ester carboxylesterase|nr:alpha/beta hydrolase [Bacteroidota bacterium]
MKTENVHIEVDGIDHPAIIQIPDSPKGVVVFAHGLRSNRFSPRNTLVATDLQEDGFATVLADLDVTDSEDERHQFFNLKKAAWHLESLVLWLKNREPFCNLPILLFGSGCGGSTAIKTAADLGDTIQAVVLRGARPDLASKHFGKLTSPTLFIVGELDFHLINLNKRACHNINCPADVAIIPGASHLFEEPGKLDKVAELTSRWYTKYVGRSTTATVI